MADKCEHGKPLITIDGEQKEVCAICDDVPVQTLDGDDSE